MFITHRAGLISGFSSSPTAGTQLWAYSTKICIVVKSRCHGAIAATDSAELAEQVAVATVKEMRLTGIHTALLQIGIL